MKLSYVFQILEGDNLELPHTFYIKSKKKIIEVHCESLEAKDQWQVALWSVINDCTTKQMSRDVRLSAVVKGTRGLPVKNVNIGMQRIVYLYD